MIAPILLVAAAGAGLLTLLLSNRTVGATAPADPAAKPPGNANELALPQTRVVMGTIALRAGGDAAETNALDKVNCADVVVAATDAKGLIVTKAPARPGSTKGECVYSLKVPAGAGLRLGVQDVTLHANVMMRKAGGEQDMEKIKGTTVNENTVMHKGAQVGNEKAIILQGGLTAANKGQWIDWNKGANEIGPLQQNLNAVFFVKAAPSVNKVKP
jgi:hypothetical protein